jgi:PAS domain S-box-containing protein
MTSHGSERVAVEALHAGAADYVVKSVESLSDMPHTADRVLREWRQRRERDRMRAELEASERKYRFLADHGVDVVWTMDLGLRLTFVSPSATRMYGWSPDEMTGLPPSAYLAPPALEALQRALAERLAPGPPADFTLELEQRRRDGTAFWAEVKARLLVDERGAPSGLIGSTRDVTQRKHAEQALEREKAFSDTVISSLPGVFFLCDERGRLLRWNDNENLVSGYSSDDLARMSLEQLFPNDRDRIVEHLARVLETGRASVEAALVTKRGAAVPLYLTGLRMVAGDRAYLVGVGIDVSERQALQQQLAHAQKMEAIGVLAGGVAHDFNNILTAIHGHASLLDLALQPADPMRKDVEQILAAVRRAAVVTKGLLSFSRKQVVKLEVLDVNEAIRAFHEISARIIGEDIDFALRLPDERLAVRLGRGQLEQVLMNLVTNARDAMPRGGRLTISTGSVASDGSRMPAGAYALVEVSDTGVGIPPESIGRVFEPFFTTKEAGKGTGLGLAIVYGIVTRHGGVVEVVSPPGGGTTFRVLLPLVTTAVEATRRAATALPLGRSETILVVEDDDLARPVVRRLLEQFGYQVLEAADGEAAVELFARNRDRIRLVLCDVIMPRKNGRETCEAIRALRPDAKVLFMSGYTGDVIANKALLEQGVEVVPKPLETADLLKSIRRLLDQR